MNPFSVVRSLHSDRKHGRTVREITQWFEERDVVASSAEDTLMMLNSLLKLGVVRSTVGAHTTVPVVVDTTPTSLPDLSPGQDKDTEICVRWSARHKTRARYCSVFRYFQHHKDLCHVGVSERCLAEAVPDEISQEMVGKMMSHFQLWNMLN